MARIPDAELAQLKREADLVALVRESGVELARHGRDFLGLCPFHEDREPSLVVSPEKGLWQCLGACKAGGSAIDWLMRSRGLGFREAAEDLRRRQGAGAGSSTSVAEPPAPPISEGERAQLLEEVLQHYERSLAGSSEAQEYAAARLISPAAIERFRLGYADRTLGVELQRLGAAGRDRREMLKAAGVLRAGTGHEHLNGCLVIPVLSPTGQVLNLYGRRIKEYPGTPRHLYLPGPRRGLWNPAGLEDTSELILCESLIDALTFWCAGFPHVTTSWGTHGFTAEHEEAIERAGIERLLLAYDHDEAGNSAAQQVVERLGVLGIACYRVLFPRGMDANDYARKVTPAKESLALALKGAAWRAGPRREGSPAISVAHARPLDAAGRCDRESESLDPLPRDPPASQSPPATSPAAVDPKQPVDVVFGDRRWRVRGLDRNLSHEKLQVLLRVARGAAFFVDTVDLAQAKHRAGFVRSAAAELELEEAVVKHDLAKLHLKLEELQDLVIRQQLAPKAAEPEPMAATAEASALAFLRRPDLLAAILADFDRCGVVGEESNKLLGYVAATSRKLERPLAVILQSSSAAGKSSLMEAILAFMPEEERVQYSAMTGQSLFYMGETDLRHKILAIVEEEGAERAAYALKLLQSEGELTIASTGKDPETGRLVTHEYRVEGPVMIFLTTTAIEIDEELLNRCLVLSVDESREQTRAIHRLQRERRTLAGMLARREREALVELHRNAQRLLRPLPVVNPYAPRLTFLDSQTRTRRDHEKYLTLIDAIALLHQHQRSHKQIVDRQGQLVEYLEVTIEDIALGNRLAGEVLGRSLDELPPQTRRFLADLERMVANDCERLALERCNFRFTRRQVCDELGWSLTQARLHLERLVEHELVLVHRGGRGQTAIYELAYAGDAAGSRVLPQLIDVERLGYVSNLAESEGQMADSEAEMAGSNRGDIGPKTVGWRTPRNGQEPKRRKPLPPLDEEPPPNSRLGSAASAHDVDVPALVALAGARRG